MGQSGALEHAMSMSCSVGKIRHILPLNPFAPCWTLIDEASEVCQRKYTRRMDEVTDMRSYVQYPATTTDVYNRPGDNRHAPRCCPPGDI
jgi:hypothetical protein